MRSSLFVPLCAGLVGAVTGLPAAQAADGDNRVGCASGPGQRQSCPGDTSAGVALVGESGSTACLLGKTWGYDDDGIWVADGCAGEFVLGAGSAAAEASSGGDSGFRGEIEAYSRLMGQVAFYDSEAEVQDNASWIGLRMSAGDKIRAFAGVEWQVSLIQNDKLFNPGASTNTEFNLTTQNVDEFALRLGFVGVDFGRFGALSLGKQWAVHYDVAGYTADRFNVFGGGIASLAYPAGTDGGESGTGRADQTLIYRNTLLRIVDIGLQTQFRNSTNDEFLDGVGASVRVRPLPGLQAGASYTKTYYDGSFKDGVPGINGDGEYIGVGARYETDWFELGAVYAKQENGDLVGVLDTSLPQPEDVTVGFDGDGIELFAKARLGAFAALAGLVDYEPDSNDPLVDSDFKTRYYVVGGEWHPTENSYAYAEYRLDDSTEADGSDGDNVLAVGFRYNFSIKARHAP